MNKRNRIVLLIGIIAALVVLLLCILISVASMGPRMGNVFSEISNPLATMPASSGSAPARQFAIQVPERVIIRQGEIALLVEDPRQAQAAIEDMLVEMEAQGAYVVSSEEWGGTQDQLPSVNMIIRVPAGRFDEVMDRLAALAVKVEKRKETAEDVTEEYVDLQERLESMEAARQRLREIMEAAETVEDLLRVEQQLSQREAEIESLQGRLQYLSQSAQLARIEIGLRPSVLGQPLGEVWQPSETVKRAYTSLLASLRAGVDFLIYFAIVILPWLLIIGAILFVARRVIRRYRPSPAAKGASKPPSE